MFDTKSARDLTIGDVIQFGDMEGNNWKITDLRDSNMLGAPYLTHRGYTAVYVGKRSRYSRQGEEQSGMIKVGQWYRVI